MPDTESPPKVMRRLDYSNGVDDDTTDAKEELALHKSRPQHLNQNNDDTSATRQKITSPLPTTPQSRSRNTLSSRTSLLGRRLAEERSRNHQLAVELKHVKSLLQREMKRNNDDDIVFDLNESFYSSSPVNTPTATPVKCRGGSNTAAALKEESYIQRIQELELALQIETQLREDAQAKLVEAEQHSKMLKPEVARRENDSAILEYLQRASHLINDTTNSSSNNNNNGSSSHFPINNENKNNGTHHSYNSLQSIDEDDEEDDGEEDHNLSIIIQKMQEYEELVTAFHSEQKNNNHNDMLSKDDVLWFFEELKWRFADIHRGVVAVAKEPFRSSSNMLDNNSEEWKNCLIGLVDELEYPMQKAKEQIISDNHEKIDSNIDNESVAAMKCNYEEQLASKSHRIKQLEADAKKQEGYCSEMQNKMKQEYHLIEEEKEKLALSKDGTAARIRYLEDVMQSLQGKLKKAQAQPPLGVGKSKATQCHTPKQVNERKDNYASEIDSLAKALADSEMKRAHLIDEFQTEREKYIAQYKQMNYTLKQFMYAE